MTAPIHEHDAQAAAGILTAVLAEPGGSLTVLTQLGTVPAFTYREGRPGRLFRAAVPDTLVIGEWEFDVALPPATLVPARHVVKGIAVQNTELTPHVAGQVLATAGFVRAAEYGTESLQRLESVVYGLSAIAGQD